MDDFGGYGDYPEDAPMLTEGDIAAARYSANKHRRGMGAKDPLLNKAHKKVKDDATKKENDLPPSSERVMQLTGLTFGPFLVYVGSLFMTAFVFSMSPVTVLLTVVIACTACVMTYLLIQHCTRKKEGKWKRWLGIFGFIAVCMGFLVGLRIHYEYMLYWSKYTNMMKYSNVAASQDAIQFEDAGAIMYTDGTTLDRTRAIGFRHIRSQQTLCVAPIVDGQMGANDDIVFFAVGVNCCGWRATFTCDDAKTGGTKGGLLMLKPNQLVSPAMEWAVDENFNFEAFDEALALQKAVFQVSAAKQYKFVRWLQDPDAKIDDFRKRGLELCLLSCGFYLIVAGVMVAADLIAEDQRQKKAVKAFREGRGTAGI